MLAIRKDHRQPPRGFRRGDALQIILIQVKGGSAAEPTLEDEARLRRVAKRHGACDVLFATWKKGTEARFSRLRPASPRGEAWEKIPNLDSVFR
jgi:hypothetical protein